MSDTRMQWSKEIIAHILFAALILLSGLLASPGQAWFLILALTTAWFLYTGKAYVGYYFGTLIDSRNRLSLSRAQSVVWSIVLLSGFATAVFVNVSRNVDEPLAVGLPEELWMLLGISTASLIGSPLLLNSKQGDKPPAVKTKKKKADACLSDLVNGEGQGNSAYVDLPRMQMGFFTIITILAYCAGLSDIFTNLGETEAVRALPTVDKGLLVLMGISHTGYLAAKPLRDQSSGPKPNDQGNGDGENGGTP